MNLVSDWFEVCTTFYRYPARDHGYLRSCGNSGFRHLPSENRRKNPKIPQKFIQAIYEILRSDSSDFGTYCIVFEL